MSGAAMGRRDLLRAGLMATAGALCGAGPFQEEGERVVVIGAGAAGLAAAGALRAAGRRVVVLEARERVGGRIWTDRSLGSPVDMGAALVEGWERNPVGEIARSMGIEAPPMDEESYVLFDADGERLSERRKEQMESGFEEAAAAAFDAAEEAEEDLSLGEAFDRVVDERDLPEERRRAYRWFLASMETEPACDLSDLSAWYGDEGDEYGGGDRPIPGGYGRITDHLAEGLDVRLGVRVRRIVHGPRGATVETDGGAYEADRVVVTLPLGVLKSGSVEFRPGLPERKRAAMERLHVGVLNKVALKFPEVAWPSDLTMFGGLGDGAEEFPEIVNLAHANGEPILLAYAAGTAAARLEALPDGEIVERVMRVLRSLGSPCLPQPRAAAVSRWGSDPFAAGSYSHIPVGGAPRDRTVLGEPVEDRLFFAGEATSRRFAATVHGAYLSGLREARRVLAVD